MQNELDQQTVQPAIHRANLLACLKVFISVFINAQSDQLRTDIPKACSLHQTHSHLHPHLSLILYLSWFVPAEGHNMADSFGEVLKVLMLKAACVNMAQQFIKMHIGRLHLCMRVFESMCAY